MPILRGKASDVAAGMRRSATLHGFGPEKRKGVDSCADYLVNRAYRDVGLLRRYRTKYREMLRYDHYLAEGLPDAAVPRILAASMNDRIVIDPKICHGKPVIRGTRTPVALIVGSLAGGMSFEEVQREYELSIEDIRAALGYVGKLVEQEQHHLLPA